MYTVGQLLQGDSYAEDGLEVVVTGEFVARTEDPEEIIQDIILRTRDGAIVYVCEQTVTPVIFL